MKLVGRLFWSYLDSNLSYPEIVLRVVTLLATTRVLTVGPSVLTYLLHGAETLWKS